MEMMCKVNPEHRENVQKVNGVKELYLMPLKALNGLMKSALLWYDLYEKTMKSQGLAVNPYDR